MDIYKRKFKFDLELENIFGYLRTIQYFIFEHYKFNVVKKNKDLIERKKADVCYICGLGPSLNDIDLMKIQGDTIVVNRFYKVGEMYPDFVPTYYLMYDAAFGEERHRDELTQALNTYSSKGTLFLFNSQLAKLNLSQEGLYYLSAFKGRFKGQNYRIDKVTPAFANVIGTAIATAMGMGYKKIVLLGCDFNSFATLMTSHAYDENSRRKRIEEWYELYRYSLVAYGHTVLSKYAQKHNIDIVNSTKGSLIDAYPFKIEESLYRK